MKNDPKRNNDDLIELVSNKDMDKLQLPYFVDLNSDDGVSSIYNTKDWEKWNIVSENDEKVLKQSAESELPSPGFAPPALRIGNSSWSDYSATFDFYIGASGRVSFILYDNSNIFQPENSFFEGNQRFWFGLHSDGRISFEMTSGVDSYYLTNDNGDYLQVEGFNPNIWNTITVKNADNNLVLFVNGVEIGAIYQLNGSECGRLALGGSSECMFKNIFIE